MVPVQGQVTYQKKPLEFGTVMFQPTSGQPARGEIQPDGTFRLTTYRNGDGVVPGPHRVRITCFESQRPGVNMPKDQEIPMLGASLIPQKYGDYNTSELEVDVGPDLTEPVVFELTDD